jgi:drug/metabolite transporter (DMT)-like permease
MLAILFIYFPLFLWYLRQSSPFLNENWFWSILSGFFQSAYCALLALAYERGDLSIIYPLSRGSAPVFITIGAILLLDERLSLTGIIGISIVVFGIYILHLRSLQFSEMLLPIRSLTQKDSQLGILTGVTIAAYHIVDKKAVSAIHPIVYLYLVQIFLFIFLSIFVFWCIYQRNRTLQPLKSSFHGFSSLKREWEANKLSIVLVGFFGYFAYLLVLVAMSMTQISYVATVRNFSIVVATILGTTVLKEPYASMRLSASLLITLGIILIALS